MLKSVTAALALSLAAAGAAQAQNLHVNPANGAISRAVKVPAGSRLIAHYVYDNSKRNPSNPDPTIKVTWGEQSHEEMLFTSLAFRWVDETAAKQVNYDELMNQTRMVGMMDDNIDGKLQKAELRGRAGEMIGKYWAMLDKNGDASLDRTEMAAAQAMMGRGRRSSSENAAMPPAQANPGGR